MFIGLCTKRDIIIRILRRTCLQIVLPRPRRSGKRPDCVSLAEELGPKADSDALVGIAAAPAAGAGAVVPQFYRGPGWECRS